MFIGKSHKNSETRFSHIESKLDSFVELKAVVDGFVASQEELRRRCANNESELKTLRDGLEGLRNDNQALRAENKALRDENLSLREEGSSLRGSVAEVRSEATHWSLAIEHCRSLGCRIDECESKVTKMEKEVETSNETIAAMADNANRCQTTAETTMTSASTLLNEKIQMAIEHIDRVEAQLDEKIAQQGETFNQTMLSRWESLSHQVIESTRSKDVDFSSQVKQHNHSEEEEAAAEAATQSEGLKNELSAHLLQLHDHNAKIDRLIDNDAIVQGTIADVNASISKLFKYVSKNCITHTERSKLVESIDKIRESISNHSASELDRDKLVCIRINNIHAAIERLFKHCERLERHLESKLNDIDVNFTKHDKLFMTLLQ